VVGWWMFGRRGKGDEHEGGEARRRDGKFVKAAPSFLWS